MTVAQMGVVLFAANEGYLKEVEVEKVKDFESSLLSYMDSEYADLMKELTSSGRYDDETAKTFKEALDKFIKTQSW